MFFSKRSFVQEKTRCIFSESRGRFGRLAVKIFLPNGRILLARAVFFEKSPCADAKEQGIFRKIAPSLVRHSADFPPKSRRLAHAAKPIFPQSRAFFCPPRSRFYLKYAARAGSGALYFHEDGQFICSRGRFHGLYHTTRHKKRPASRCRTIALSR